MTASFTASLAGGTGADGLTFALLDPARSTKNSLGATGGALGFGGLSGTAVTLDTAQGTGEPSANFVGVATANAGALRYVATTTAVPALRTGTHAVVVTTVGGHLTVSVDGTQVLDTVVAIPPTALLAFTSGTGSITDVHTVSAISVQAKRSTLAASLTGTGWGRAGKAVVSGTGVQLTASTTYASGSTFLTTAYPAAGLHVRYTATITPGTGADGMALALLDSTKSTSLSLGALGGGLGYGGLAGIAVTSDSFQNTGDPGADLIGIASGVKTKNDQLNYIASTASKGGLTVGSHVIDVWTADGKLYVAVDGLVRLSPVLALPTSVRLGFTAGTGGLTDTHVVSNVTVASG
jgi:hypothetical protein